MKFKKLLIFPLILTIFGTSCSKNNKIYIEQKENIDSFVYVDNAQLTTLINNKQNFVLVVGERGCSTCDIIKPVIVDYIKKYEYIIYWIENNIYQTVVDKFVNSETQALKADIMSASILLFNSGVTKDVIEYNNNLYYSDSKLELTLEKKITGSNIYSLNTLETYSYSPSFDMYKFNYSSTIDLDNKLASSRANVVYSWGPCPDCIRFKDEVLYDYMPNSQNKIYSFEVSYFRDDYSNSPDLYNQFTLKYQFDNYRGGKVPSIVTYENNKKVNMHVYFNDEFEKQEDDSYIIKNSYIPELINTTYSSGKEMYNKLVKIHKEKAIEYLDNNL